MTCAGCGDQLADNGASDMYCGEECQRFVLAAGAEPLYEETLRDLGYMEVDYGDQVSWIPVPR